MIIKVLIFTVVVVSISLVVSTVSLVVSGPISATVVAMVMTKRHLLELIDWALEDSNVMP